MLFTMMHKTYPVLDFEIKNDRLHSILKIYHEDRIPLNLQNSLTEENLEKWIKKRSIPTQRPYFHELYKSVFHKKFWVMLQLSAGFNLSDQYWFREDSKDYNWKDCNYFTNPFSYEIGNYLTIQKLIQNPEFLSPDLFTNGNNPKTWRVKNNERFLLKGSVTPNDYDCINEKIIADYINSLNLPYITCPETDLTKIKGNIYSCSKNFITEYTELVPAHYLTEYKKKEDSKLMYHHLEDICQELKIPHVKSFLNHMIAIDNVTCQSDRHLGNFGFIRDADTLEFIGPAPLYDNGNCLWFKDETNYIGSSLLDMNCKPFAYSHDDQKKLIDDQDIIKTIDTQKLQESIIKNAAPFMNQKRIHKILENIKRREERLERGLERKEKELDCLYR